jgi:hypothetical protein
VGTALASRLIALRPAPDSPAHSLDTAPSSHPPHAAHPTGASTLGTHLHAHDDHTPNAAHDDHTPNAAHDDHTPTPHATNGLFTCLHESAPWVIVGVVLATLLVAAPRDGAFTGLSATVALFGVSLLALPLELPAVAAVFIALALWDRGLRPDAALAFALIASVPKPDRRALAVALLVGLGVGSVNGRSVLYIQMPHVLGALGIGLLALGLAVAAWQRGVRGLFTAVFHSHDTA